MTFTPARRLLAELLGTLLLVATVVGSGIMAESLTRDVALALMGNTLATGAILVVLISMFGAISGAHFNPAVSLVMWLKGDLRGWMVPGYMLAQIAGGLLGTWLAHAMFAQEIMQVSQHARSGAGQWLAEAVATFGLLATILAGVRFRPEGVAWMVGLYITAGYWFTASTSFANPAVTIARAWSDTFAGIAPAHVPAFVAAQLAGALLALALFGWLLKGQGEQAATRP